MRMQLLYPFFLRHPEQIPQTAALARVQIPVGPWARHAANMAVVKFVRRR